MISRLTAGLQYPLSTLHERRCRRPCKTRFRLAGSAFTGRVSNPLGHDERFQVKSVLLSRAYPDASWAHGRRKLFDIAKLTKAPIASEAVRRIDEIFAVERTINGRSAAERVAARQQQSKPLILDLEIYLREQRMLLSAKSDTAKAITYILSRWVAFTRFLDDGRICLTNNAAERALRGIAIGRRNWTFCGSDAGGHRAAAIYTLIETAKLNDVDPQAWLADVLARLPDHPAKRLDELLPWNWKASRPGAALAQAA